MLDVPVDLTQAFARSVEANSRNGNGSPISTVPSGLSKANRFQDPQRHATPLGDSEMPIPSLKRLRQRSRESSVLANNVANHLSIESPEDRLEASMDNFVDRSDGEHEPTAPYNSSLPTGLCYDVRMRYHCELDPPKQRFDYHPEDPRRIFKIYKELCIAGLVKDALLNTGTVIPKPLVNIPARDVTPGEVCLVHDKKHFDFMRSTSSKRCTRPYLICRQN